MFALVHGLLTVAGIVALIHPPLPIAVWVALTAAALATRVWNGFSMYGRPHVSHVAVNIAVLASGVFLTLQR
ncbi:MAG: hypothetical protein ACYCVB_06125 [Bacilli bacterium]